MPDRLLIVDDDESLQELCAAAFKLDGYHVEVASSGEGGLKKLDAAPFDLVVTDLFMPGKLDGAGLVRAVKARFPSTEVIVMTAVPTLKTAISTLKDGASDYVIKPFETDHLRVIARRALEQRRLRRELDTERAMRQELATAYKELQKVEELKESFLARISHELRTPLSELLTAVELMEQAAGSTTDPQKLSRYIGLSKQGATRMERTLSDLLAFVELQRRPLVEKGKEVSIAGVCRDVVERLKPLTEPRGIHVELKFPDGLPNVVGDPELLQRAFEHLIHNAAVFNKDKGRITLNARAEAGSIYLDVSDTGEGIPQEEFERIFDSFYQIASYLTRKVGGLGLGLAITRRIVEAHGGHIDVTSKVGEGTTFRVRLPFKADAKPAASAV
ncbi:MAG: response regulator [Elusimicrobia bacterium]|nr:response regulator [Elusimicrobiota bacterium]